MGNFRKEMNFFLHAEYRLQKQFKCSCLFCCRIFASFFVGLKPISTFHQLIFMISREKYHKYHPHKFIYKKKTSYTIADINSILLINRSKNASQVENGFSDEFSVKFTLFFILLGLLSNAALFKAF